MMMIRSPLESLLVRLHNDIQSRVKMKLVCSNKLEIDSFVGRDIESIVNPEERECIRFIQNRINMLDYTEGVVFKWRGKLTKLTGLFTRLNRAKWLDKNVLLLGFFDES